MTEVGRGLRKSKEEKQRVTSLSVNLELEDRDDPTHRAEGEAAKGSRGVNQKHREQSDLQSERRNSNTPFPSKRPGTGSPV